MASDLGPAITQTLDFFANPQSDDAASDTLIQAEDGKMLVAVNNAVIRYQVNGRPDASFGSVGNVNINVDSPKLLRQADGKILAVGTTLTGNFNNERSLLVARLNVNGTLDRTFGNDGYAGTNELDIRDVGPYAIEGVSLDSIGNLYALVAPNRNMAAQLGLSSYIAKFTVDGIADTTFGDAYGRFFLPAGTDFDGGDLLVQTDGKIVLLGEEVLSSTDTQFAVTRLNADGTVDTSFGTNGVSTINVGSSVDDAAALIIQPDGKFVLGGSAYDATGISNFAIARLNANGTRDTAFGVNGIRQVGIVSRATLNDLALDSDGRIIAVGSARNNFGSSYFGTTRLTPAGAIDFSFNSIGRANDEAQSSGFFGFTPPFRNSSASAVAVYGSRIFVVGGLEIDYVTNTYHLGTIAYRSSDGAYDPTYAPEFRTGPRSTQIKGIGETANAIAATADGKFVVAGPIIGDFITTEVGVSRYNSNGSIDTTFGDAGRVVTNLGGFVNGLDGQIQVVVQPDGKILVSGGYQQYTTNFIVRFNIDGSLDTTFGVNGVITQFENFAVTLTTDMALQSDGKIVVVGRYAGIGYFVRRYNTNGSLDNTFNNGGIFNNFNGGTDALAEKVLVQSDGKIVVVGTRITSSYEEMAVASYMPDGTVDGTFGNSGVAVTRFHESYVNDDLIEGSYNFLGESTELNVAQYARAYGAAFDSAGNIVVTGTINLKKVGLARFTTSGDLDSTFRNGGIGFKGDTAVHDIQGAKVAIAPSGKIVVIGSLSRSGQPSDSATLVYESDGRITNPENIVVSDFNNQENKLYDLLIRADGSVVTVGNGWPTATSGSSSETFSSFLIESYNLATAGNVIVSPTSGLITSESGQSATFQVRLGSAPTADVSIPVQSSNTGEVAVTTSQLIFTSSNWSVPQTVSVIGQADLALDGDQPFTIVLGTTSSSDPAYNGINPADVTGSNIDVNANQAPVQDLPLVGQTITRGAFFSYTFAADTFRDPDAPSGSALIYSLALTTPDNVPSWLQINSNTRTISGTVPSDFSLGGFTILVNARDNGNAFDPLPRSVAGRLTLTIAAANQPPTVITQFTDETVHAKSNFRRSLSGQFNDPEQEPLTFTAELSNGDPLPEWVSFVPSSFSIQGNAPAEVEGIYSIRIIAVDPHGLLVSAVFQLTVTPALPPANIVYVDPEFLGDEAESDPDGDGPATIFGYDAFSEIQEAIDAVAIGGTVVIHGGSYGQRDSELPIGNNGKLVTISLGDGIDGTNSAAYVGVWNDLIFDSFATLMFDVGAPETGLPQIGQDYDGLIAFAHTIDISGQPKLELVGSLGSIGTSYAMLFATARSGTQIVGSFAGQTAEGYLQTDAGLGQVEIDGTTLTITVPDLPQITWVDTIVGGAEGDVGTTEFLFNVVRTGDLSSGASVNYQVAPNNEAAGSNLPAEASDFLNGVFPSGVVTFEPNEGSKLIIVQVTADESIERNEEFRVVLSNPSSGSTLGISLAIGTIFNDDADLSGAASVNEGSPYTLNLSSATELAGQAVERIDIYWGDGSVESYEAGLHQATHTYLDGDASFEVYAEYISIENSLLASTNVLLVNVLNVAPTATIYGFNAIVEEGNAFDLRLTITDPGTESRSATIDWGDGQQQTVPSNITQLYHTYETNGDFQISLSVIDEDGTYSNIATTTAQVRNIAPIVTLIDPPTLAQPNDVVTIRFRVIDPGISPEKPLDLLLFSGGVEASKSNLLFDPATGIGSFDVTFNSDFQYTRLSVQVADSDGAHSNVATKDVSSPGGGLLDPSFGDRGVVSDSNLPVGASTSWRNVALQADGKSVAVGYSRTPTDSFLQLHLARFNLDGSVDQSFQLDENTPGHLPYGVSGRIDVAVDSEGRIVVVTSGRINDAPPSIHGSNVFVFRFLSDGQLDPAFVNGGVQQFEFGFGFDDEGVGEHGLVIQSDDKILITGNAKRLEDGVYGSSIAAARLNQNGSFDTSFGVNGKISLNATQGVLETGTAAVLQSDQKIVIVGSSNGRNLIVRLNQDGSYDNSFGLNGQTSVALPYNASPSSFGAAVTVDRLGKIIVGGFGSTGTNTTGTDYRYYVTRLNEDGSADPTFGNSGVVTDDPSGRYSSVRNLALDSQERIVLIVQKEGGVTTGLASTIRLLPNGAVDTLFGTIGETLVGIPDSSATYYTRPYDGLVQQDGSVIVVGDWFQKPFGLTRSAIFRLLGSSAVPNGALNGDGSGIEANDTLLIDLANAKYLLNGVENPLSGVPELTFDGGGGENYISWANDGGETIYEPDPDDPSKGKLTTSSGLTIRFVNMTAIDVDSISSLIVRSPESDDNILLAAGSNKVATADGFNPGELDTIQITTTSGSVLNISRSANLEVNTILSDGEDTVVIDSIGNGHGIDNLYIRTGTGADTVRIDGLVSVSGLAEIQTATIDVRGILAADHFTQLGSTESVVKIGNEGAIVGGGTIDANVENQGIVAATGATPIVLNGTTSGTGGYCGGSSSSGGGEPRSIPTLVSLSFASPPAFPGFGGGGGGGSGYGGSGAFGGGGGLGNLVALGSICAIATANTTTEITFAGTTTPGNSPAQTLIAGGAILDASNRFIVEIGGETAGAEFDQILSSGQITIGGTLEVRLLDLGNGFMPTIGKSFVIVQANQIVGSFADVSYPQLPAGANWRLIYSPTNVTLSVVPDPLVDISLVGSTVNENAAAGTIIGNVSSTLTGMGPVLFQLVPSAVDNDNFELIGTELRSTRAFDFESKNEYTLRLSVSLGDGQSFETDFVVNVTDLPEVSAVTIGDGSSQRSIIKTVQVSFDGVVDIADLNATDINLRPIQVKRRGISGGVVDTTAVATQSNGKTIVMLTFAGAFTDAFGSLMDGNYQMVIEATKVSRNGNSLDGDRNGITDGNFLFGTNQQNDPVAADRFFRLLGDASGDGIVGNDDLKAVNIAYRSLIGSPIFNAAYDFDQDGVIGNNDLKKMNMAYRNKIVFK